MLRYRGRTMQLGVGRRGLDPRWTGLPSSTGHWPAVHKTITSKKSGPMVGSSRPPPAQWGGSPELPGSGSSTGPPPPHAPFLQLPLPSHDVPLTSPPASPAPSRVGKANCSRPSSASCPSSTYQGVVPHSPSAAVRVPSPRSGGPLLSAPASHARTIVWTDKWFWLPSALFPSTGPPPPIAGSSRPPPAPWGGSPALPASCLSTGPPPHAGFLQIPSSSDDVPLPSPPANPGHSCVGKANCCRPSSASCPSSAYEGAGVLVPSPCPKVPLLSAAASDARSSIAGTENWFSPPSALCPSTPPGAGLMLLAPGAGVPLLSPPKNHGRGGVAMYKSFQPHQSHARSVMGTDRSFQPPSGLSLSTGLMPLAPGAGVSLMSPTELSCPGGIPTLNRSRVSPANWQLGSWPRTSHYTGQRSALIMQLRISVSGNMSKCRAFSSSRGDDKSNWKPVTLNNPPLMIKSTELQVDGKLKPFKPKFMGPKHLLQTLAKDIQEFNIELFDLDNMKKLYHDQVRDLLVSNGLIIDDKVVHDTYLRDLSRKFHPQQPDKPLVCITALDVMRALIPLTHWKWSHLLSYLRDNKIMILEWWDVALATIETMLFSYGWKLDLGDRTLHKGVSKGVIKAFPFASLYSVIWKKKEIEDCCISLGVKCSSALEAELLSLYLLERRGINLGVKDLLIATRDGNVDKILREATMVEANDSRIKDLSMLVVGQKAKFENLFCQEEPSEVLLVPEVLSKIEKVESLAPPQAFEFIRDSWSDCLSGAPSFRLHQQGKANHAMKKFLARRRFKNPPKDGKLILKNTYKVKVESESRKVDAFRNVMMSLLPNSAIVLVDNEEKAHLVKNELINLFSENSVRLAKNKEGPGYLVLFEDGSDIRNLVIIWDSSIKDDFNENKLTVRLLLKEKEDDLSIQDLAPECYFFFNAEGGERLEIGENIIKPNPKPE